MIKISEWKARLEQEREEKDRFFLNHPQSPIPLEDLRSFKGLVYYPSNLDYRFELELREHSDKKRTQIEDTGGNMRNFLCWGEFRFKISDEECRLQAYKSDLGGKRLFIPFKDVPSGKEPYGTGRYLDLADDKDKTPMGKWVLDFNRAYKPWCAYSENYVCPFVPSENWLKVSICAGEKNYPHQKSI